MNNIEFEEAELRLKDQLGVKQAKDIAKALHMTSAAWSARKKRGNFPVAELYKLKGEYPEFSIDVDYILTGVKGNQKNKKVVLATSKTTGENTVREVNSSYVPVVGEIMGTHEEISGITLSPFVIIKNIYEELQFDPKFGWVDEFRDLMIGNNITSIGVSRILVRLKKLIEDHEKGIAAAILKSLTVEEQEEIRHTQTKLRVVNKFYEDSLAENALLKVQLADTIAELNDLKRDRSKA